MRAIPRCEGEYIYLGVETGVTRLISNFPDYFQEREIKIDLNVDGIPVGMSVLLDEDAKFRNEHL